MNKRRPHEGGWYFQGFDVLLDAALALEVRGIPVFRSASPTELYARCSTPADLAASAMRMPS